MSPRPRRVLAILGIFSIAAGLGAAAMQDDGKTWKVHAKDRPQPEMVEPGRASTDKPGEPGQHLPQEQQQLKARASDWLRTALRGRRKK